MRHEVLDSIGARIARIRGQQSQADFAAIVGLAKNTVGNYERGDREIGALALCKLVSEGWNANWLLTGEGPDRLDAAVSRKGDAPGLDVQALEQAIRGALELLQRHRKAPAVGPLTTIITQLYLVATDNVPDPETPVQDALERAAGHKVQGTPETPEK